MPICGAIGFDLIMIESPFKFLVVEFFLGFLISACGLTVSYHKILVQFFFDPLRFFTSPAIVPCDLVFSYIDVHTLKPYRKCFTIHIFHPSPLSWA